MYKSSMPLRHKYDRKTLKQFNKNINIPLFSIYYTKNGEERDIIIFNVDIFIVIIMKN